MTDIGLQRDADRGRITALVADLTGGRSAGHTAIEASGSMVVSGGRGAAGMAPTEALPC